MLADEIMKFKLSFNKVESYLVEGEQVKQAVYAATVFEETGIENIEAFCDMEYFTGDHLPDIASVAELYESFNGEVAVLAETGETLIKRKSEEMKVAA